MPCIIYGGKVYTGVGDQKVEALLVGDGKIVFAGPLAEALRRAPDAAKHDLRGRVAYPGLIDAHAHLLGIGMRELTLNLDNTISLVGLLAQVAAYARANPSGPITGRGWIETLWPERRFPTAADLDAIVPDRPVFLVRADGHAAVANSAALALGGIGPATPDPDGGRIERTAGRPTGMLVDNAMELVRARLPGTTRAMRREALRRGAVLYASRGWTGLADMGATRETVELLHELAAAGELPIRVDTYLLGEEADELFAGKRSVDPTGLVNVRGIKLFADGALGSRGAALLAPYADAPGNGLLVTPPALLRERMKAARRAGVQVATHAIGDRASRLVLDLYREVFEDDPTPLRRARWRVEHAQILDPVDIPRFAANGVIASMQFSHAIDDLYFAPTRLGEARLAGAYAWRSLLDSGAALAAGSDAPVEQGDPRIEFYAGCYRHDLKGQAGPDWHLEQRLSRAETLRALTAGGAFAAFDESRRGTLAPGMLADITVLSGDLMAADPRAFLSIRPLLTIVGGRVVHGTL